MYRVITRLLIAVSLIMTPRLVSASAIQFNVIDLTDTTLGEDLWWYQYHIDGFTFSPDQGFTVYFNADHDGQ